MRALLARAAARGRGATIFAYPVENPGDYGVVEFDAAGRVVGLEEKPLRAKSNQAVTGLYFYDRQAVELARTLVPSARGELEITDLNRLYLERGELSVETLSRGYAWLDTGAHDSLLEAAEFVRALQRRQGLFIACLEEIAYANGFIDREQLRARGQFFAKTGYGRYLLELADRGPTS